MALAVDTIARRTLQLAISMLEDERPIMAITLRSLLPRLDEPERPPADFSELLSESAILFDTLAEDLRSQTVRN